MQVMFNSCPVYTALPQIAALPETKEVTVGSDAVLPCVASGYPVPEIKWSKVTKTSSRLQTDTLRSIITL